MRLHLATIGLVLSVALLVATGCGPSAAETQQAAAKVAQEQHAQAAAQAQADAQRAAQAAAERQKALGNQREWVRKNMKLPTHKLVTGFINPNNGEYQQIVGTTTYTVEVADACKWRIGIHEVATSASLDSREGTNNCTVRLSGLPDSALKISSNTGAGESDNMRSTPTWFLEIEDRDHIQCDIGAGRHLTNYDFNLQFSSEANAEKISKAIMQAAQEMCGSDSAGLIKQAGSGDAVGQPSALQAPR